MQAAAQKEMSQRCPSISFAQCAAQGFFSSMCVSDPGLDLRCDVGHATLPPGALHPNKTTG